MTIVHETYAPVLSLLTKHDRPSRVLVAIVGAPGSGKSTLAERLARDVNANGRTRAAVVPMDGFHLDDGLLTARGLLKRKGAQNTFDVGGLRSLLERLRKNAEGDIIIPLFDRSIEIARAGAVAISEDVELLLVEGNYLTLKYPPWTQLDGLFDLTIQLDVSEPELRRRLAMRWEGYGLSEEQILEKLEENDLPNGRVVRTESRAPDYLLKNDSI